MLCSNYTSLKALNFLNFFKHTPLNFHMYTHTFLEKLSMRVKKYSISLKDIVLMGQHIQMHNLQLLSCLQLVHMKDMGASIIKWTKKVLRYTKAIIFLVKRL